MDDVSLQILHSAFARTSITKIQTLSTAVHNVSIVIFRSARIRIIYVVNLLPSANFSSAFCVEDTVWENVHSACTRRLRSGRIVLINLNNDRKTLFPICVGVFCTTNETVISANSRPVYDTYAFAA